MKRMRLMLALFIAVFVLGCAETYAEEKKEIDISSLSVEELLQLQNSIENRLKESDDGHENSLESEKTNQVEDDKSFLNRNIEISADSDFVYNGKSIKLKATVTRNDEESPKTTKINWKTSDSEVATVSKDGTVRGISAGSAIITAVADDDSRIFGNYHINVRVSVKELKTEEKTINLLLGGNANNDKAKINAIVLPEDAFNQSLSYVSSNPNIVKVDNQGNLQGISVGKAKVTIKSEDDSSGSMKTTQVNVTVNQSVTAIKVENKIIRIGVGKTATVKAEVAPASAGQKKLQYISSDEKVATVTQNGTVTGKKAGKCVIKCIATDGSGIENSCQIEVNQLVTNITVKNYKAGKTLYLIEGETKKIEYSTQPSDATNKTILLPPPRIDAQ